MKNIKLNILLSCLVIVSLVASTFFYTVQETEHAIRLQFGDIREVIFEPGLKIKYPFINNVIKLDNRNLEYDVSQSLEIIVKGEERLEIDAFARYRIVDPRLYYERNSRGATDFFQIRRNGEGRLGEILDNDLRDVLGAVSIEEIVRERRDELMKDIKQATQSEAETFGVEIIDVRIKRADFLQENAARVYARMITDQQQIAEKTRAEGAEQALIIRAEADKDVISLVAQARETAEVVKGKADGERNAIFATTYNKDPDFFEFYRTMTLYTKSMQSGDKTMVLSPDSDVFSYLQDMEGNK